MYTSYRCEYQYRYRYRLIKSRVLNGNIKVLVSLIVVELTINNRIAVLIKTIATSHHSEFSIQL